MFIHSFIQGVANEYLLYARIELGAVDTAVRIKIVSAFMELILDGGISCQ